MALSSIRAVHSLCDREVGLTPRKPEMQGKELADIGHNLTHMSKISDIACVYATHVQSIYHGLPSNSINTRL
jgi:hypothetical protein